MAYLVKSFIANVTLVGLFTRMSKTMILVISFLMESFPTKFTYPWFVSVVNPHVSVESRASVEGLATSQALVRLLICVNDLVTTQGRGLSESFPTNFAHKRSSSCKLRIRMTKSSRPDNTLDTCMHWHVSGEVVVSVEYFPTLRTREGFLLGLARVRGRGARPLLEVRGRGGEAEGGPDAPAQGE